MFQEKIFQKNEKMRYLDFHFFVKPVGFQICDVIIGIATKWKLLLCLFF